MQRLFTRSMGMVAALMGISACERAPEHARHTVEDYRGDDALRREAIELCANDPGTLGETPDCINAKRASRIEDTHSLRDLPPVTLPSTR